MTHEIPTSAKTTTCAFFTFTGTPTLSNPLTPVLVGSSTGTGITISSNDIQLPAGEYVLRFFGAITRTAGSLDNMRYQWRQVAGALIGVAGASNRADFTTKPASIDPADAHLVTATGTSVQVEITGVDPSVVLDTANSHAVIWRVS